MNKKIQEGAIAIKEGNKNGGQYGGRKLSEITDDNQSAVAHYSQIHSSIIIQLI